MASTATTEQIERDARAIVTKLGHRRAAELLLALVEAIDASLSGLVAGEDMAEGSIYFDRAFDACDDYRAYVCDDVHVRADRGLAA